MMTYEDKIDLKRKLLQLESTDLFVIHEMLDKDNVTYSRNNSGIYFKEDNISNTLLEKINDYVNTIHTKIENNS